MSKWYSLARRREGGSRNGLKAAVWGLGLAVVAVLAMSAGGIPAVRAATDTATSSAPEPKVVRIIVQGNQNIPTEKILAAITHTKVGEPLDKDKLQADLQAIADLGWFDPASLEARWDRSTQDSQGVDLTVVVHEYPVIQKIEVKGTTRVTPAVVEGYLRAKEGQVFNRREIQEDVWALPQKLFDEKGIAVRPTDLAFDQEKGVLTLTLTESRVGKIVIEGNQKTKDYVIRRELPIHEGDPLDMEKLREGLRRIIMLGFFDEVTPQFVNTDNPDVVDIHIAVKERKTGQASVGAGYSTASGIMGYLEVADSNFLGRGEGVKLRLQAGKSETSYEASFYEPYLDSHRTSLNLELYNTKTSQSLSGVRDAYQEHRVGGSITLGRPVTEYTQATVGLKIEDVNNTQSQNYQGAEPIPEDGASHVLTLGLLTDTTDHPFFPTQGYRNSLSVAFGGGLLKGDWDFSKYQDELSFYKKVGVSNQVLAVRSAAGYASGNVPAQEIFRVGGADTVRGYEYGNFTGNQMFLVNTEYRFPITKQLGGVVFVDSGYAWQQNETVRLQDLKTGMGVGIRLDTPIGLLRLDYGVGQGVGRAYFSLGQAF
ncbi:MAG: BamA/TamA family outer membrane protein [Limnochordaceae bacterium]|nr:BamA/TamA family outer membrane protein [Limnochordaceae bacterium]